MCGKAIRSRPTDMGGNLEKAVTERSGDMGDLMEGQCGSWEPAQMPEKLLH